MSRHPRKPPQGTRAVWQPDSAVHGLPAHRFVTRYRRDSSLASPPSAWSQLRLSEVRESLRCSCCLRHGDYRLQLYLGPPQDPAARQGASTRGLPARDARQRHHPTPDVWRRSRTAEGRRGRRGARRRRRRAVLASETATQSGGRPAAGSRTVERASAVLSLATPRSGLVRLPDSRSPTCAMLAPPTLVFRAPVASSASVPCGPAPSERCARSSDRVLAVLPEPPW